MESRKLKEWDARDSNSREKDAEKPNTDTNVSTAVNSIPASSSRTSSSPCEKWKGERGDYGNSVVAEEGKGKN